jgi:hypothetical protein
MYQQSISRKRPGCIMFLLDRSDSMARPWGGGKETLAAGAAHAINGILFELCLRAQKGPSLVHHYFDIGIFGYGTRPSAGGEGVESAFGGALATRALVSIPEIRQNPIAEEETSSPDLPGMTVRKPVWVQPMSGYRTPMCEAISVAGDYVAEWTEAHPESFPPIIINITDGIVTDSPYDGADVREWAQRLTTLGTRDGTALLFNVFVSPETTRDVIFPDTSKGLPEPGPDLFEMSSELPGPIIRNAANAGVPTVPGSRGFAFNISDSATLVRIIEIGTRLDTRD